MFDVLFNRCYILAIPSRRWFNVDMGYVVRACAIMHDLNVECRDEDDSKGALGMVSIDPNAEAINIQTIISPTDRYAQSEQFP